MRVQCVLAAAMPFLALAAAWAPTPVVSSGPGVGPGSGGPVSLEGPWPVAPPAEGCGPPASVVLLKVLTLLLGVAAIVKIPLLLAKLIAAKIVMLIPLALPLLLPLIAPFMLVAALLPMQSMMDDSSPTPGPVTPAPPTSPTPGGNVVPGPGDQTDTGRSAWIERCLQRAACRLHSHRSDHECARFYCPAMDWVSL